MARRWARRAWVAVAFAVMAVPAAALRLERVLASGLAAPVFVTSARDGSGRLYVVERGGRVLVFIPGVPPATFVDLSASVAAGGERGLLGLAFHPGYAANGRLFVYYTRAGDGAIVVAEHRRSIVADVADPVGRALLTIPHPGASNHNGGMLAFGPDGYLYIGTGDGGAANDPPNNAQNRDVLLGKILRIDVDRADASAGTGYSAPPDNPFVGTAGRDEIFAWGLRNPWRFAFDRATGALWVADVGQDAREEVNAPVVRGGNYGWRVYEGTTCTNNDPALCDPSAYLGPAFEYPHALGRCSITGGYPYRGARGTLAAGSYVYADFCTGEIFAWNGAFQAVLRDTDLAIASFGEDESGELYVVDINGGVHRLAPDGPAVGATAVEFFHAGFGHYFTTAIDDEIAKLDAGVFEGWVRTGESFGVLPAGGPGSQSVCRFFSDGFAPKSSHFYTPIEAECERVKRDPAWQFEGEVYGVAPPDAAGRCAASMQPLYRLYNDGQGGAPNHRYTTQAATRSAMLANGWIAEGVGELGVIGCVPGAA